MDTSDEAPTSHLNGYWTPNVDKHASGIMNGVLRLVVLYRDHLLNLIVTLFIIRVNGLAGRVITVDRHSHL